MTKLLAALLLVVVTGCRAAPQQKTDTPDVTTRLITVIDGCNLWSVKHESRAPIYVLRCWNGHGAVATP